MGAPASAASLHGGRRVLLVDAAGLALVDGVLQEAATARDPSVLIAAARAFLRAVAAPSPGRGPDAP